MEKTFTISELEKVTGISRRTIYFYTQEKLIPPPVGAGLSAKYDETHYLRLKLIQALQKSHLKLSGIKEAIDKMSLREMRDKIKTIEHNNDWQFGEVFNSISKSFFSKRKNEVSAVREADSAPFNDGNISFVSSKLPVSSTNNTVKEAGKSFEVKKTIVPKTDTTWKRYDVMEGIEVNVRSDIDSEYGELLNQLLNEFYKHIKVRGLK